MASVLTPRERELVAIGASIGSNCIPCIEYHIQQARGLGLTDTQISLAIQLANKVRQAPARKVLERAGEMIPEFTLAEGGDSCCCQPDQDAPGRKSCC